MDIVINGVSHRINEVVYPEQCQSYYDALSRGDMYAAHILHLPPVYLSYEQIMSKIKILEMKASLDYELERVKNMPNELLEIEIKSKFLR